MAEVFEDGQRLSYTADQVDLTLSSEQGSVVASLGDLASIPIPVGKVAHVAASGTWIWTPSSVKVHDGVSVVASSQPDAGKWELLRITPAAAIADATDAASAITQVNAWLAVARARGEIAT